MDSSSFPRPLPPSSSSGVGVVVGVVWTWWMGVGGHIQGRRMPIYPLPQEREEDFE